MLFFSLSILSEVVRNGYLKDHILLFLYCAGREERGGIRRRVSGEGCGTSGELHTGAEMRG
jgi:hypothetical protein